MEQQQSNRRDWREMDHDELTGEVKLWRARALQNRAERERVETEAENWRLRYKLEHRNLMGLKQKLKDAERRIAELEATA